MSILAALLTAILVITFLGSVVLLYAVITMHDEPFSKEEAQVMARRQFLSPDHPEVCGVSTDSKGIVILLRYPTSKHFPRKYLGFPVTKQYVGEVKAQ